MKVQDYRNISLKEGNVEKMLAKASDKAMKMIGSQEFDEYLKRIDDSLDILSDKQKEIIRLRYGLSSEGSYGTKYSLDEIGDKFGLTRERVRQVKNKAVRVLQFKNQEKLEDLLDFNEVNLERIFLEEGKEEKYLNQEGDKITPKNSLGIINFKLSPRGTSNIYPRGIAMHALDLEEESNAYLIHNKKHIGFGNYHIPVEFFQI